MNQLPIEHLAPYLAYDLKVVKKKDYHSEIWENGEICTVYQIGKSLAVSEWFMANKEHFFNIAVLNENPNSVSNYESLQFKPILRPLQDLTKEINHRGEVFVPVERMYAIASSETERSFVNVLLHLKRYESDDTDKTHKDIFSRAPYSMHCYACELHFDVFGLISAGLAISVHDLTENPYEK